jgi:hypothetical protein
LYTFKSWENNCHLVLKTFPLIFRLCSQALVAHTCNASYSGGRDQEDHGLKPTWANSCVRLLSPKNPSQKRAGRVVQGIGPEFKHQYLKKKLGCVYRGWGRLEKRVTNWQFHNKYSEIPSIKFWAILWGDRVPNSFQKYKFCFLLVPGKFQVNSMSFLENGCLLMKSNPLASITRFPENATDWPWYVIHRKK